MYFLLGSMWVRQTNIDALFVVGARKKSRTHSCLLTVGLVFFSGDLRGQHTHISRFPLMKGERRYSQRERERWFTNNFLHNCARQFLFSEKEKKLPSERRATAIFSLFVTSLIGLDCVFCHIWQSLARARRVEREMRIDKLFSRTDCRE